MERLSALILRENVQIYVEEWAASYGSPLLFPSDDDTAAAVMVEDGEDFRSHSGHAADQPQGIAFVDGVRRAEASLYQEDPASRAMIHGIAAAHACGAVVCVPGERPAYRDITVSRMVVWGGGLTGVLPAVPGGWAWSAYSVDSTEVDAPLKDLQRRMRKAEAELAERMMGDGYVTIVDGPLSYLRNLDLPVIGYVKTHHRRLLSLQAHVLVATLGPGERSSLFRLGEDRYSCYLRLLPVPPGANPWHAIVRLELPQSVGLAAAVAVADRAAALLPRFAGIAHCDPRAPQNLQPVGALEDHLRHRMAPAALAYRAVRDAAAALRNSVSA
jgi:hypothetical protein